jgi:hypothetical protein
VHDADQRPAPPPAPAPEPHRDGPTGDAAVDGALTGLADLEELPVREHVAVFDAVHAALQDRLADVED